MSSYSKGEEAVKESLMKQTLKLQHKLKQTVSNASILEDHYTNTLEDLEAKVTLKKISKILFTIIFFSTQ